MTFEVSKNLEGLYCYAASPEAAVDLVQRLETQDNSEVGQHKISSLTYFESRTSYFTLRISNVSQLPFSLQLQIRDDVCGSPDR
jgi:hypothetical protein